MAVFCLAVLLVALGIAAALSVPQLGEDSVIPEVSVAPDTGIGLDDAVAVPPLRQLAVASGHPAVAGGPRLAASVVAGAGADSAGVGVGSARVVATVAPAGPPTAPPTGSPQSPAAEPAPQPTPNPVVVPVSTPAPAPVAVPTPPQPEPGTRPPGTQPPGPIPSGGGDLVWGPVQVHDGDEYAYSFSFYAHPVAYRAPGEDNLILRIGDETDQNHSFGLQLWDDDNAQRGLWASGEAMDGERFLAPLAEGVWHQVVLYLQASSGDDGFYLLLLDGEPIDTRAWIDLIGSEDDHGLLEAGLFREGERINVSPEIVFGPTRLSATLESVIP